MPPLAYQCISTNLETEKNVNLKMNLCKLVLNALKRDWVKCLEKLEANLTILAIEFVS